MNQIKEKIKLGKEALNQAFMDEFIFGQSCVVMDKEGNIRRIHPMSDEFMKLKQQEDV